MNSTTMAEGNRNDESYSSWFGGWLAAAKEKSEKAFEMVCNDLDEFTSTMQKDTKKVVDQTKQTLKNDENSKTASDRLKSGFTCLMDGITKALTVEPEDTSPPKTQPIKPDESIFDRTKARIRAIQVDTGTYLDEPTGPPEQFADWLHSFDLDSKKGDISDLLISMVEVRSLYATLVPSQVSHQEFWQRYFYKIHQLELDEARKQALMKRADNVQTKEDSIGWDDEEWSADEDQTTPRNQEEIESRLHPVTDSKENSKKQVSGDTVQSSIDNQSVDGCKTVPAETVEKSETQSSTLKDKDTGQSDDAHTETGKNINVENNMSAESKIEWKNTDVVETDTGDSVEKDRAQVESVTASEKDSDEVSSSGRDSVDGKVCDDKVEIVKDEAAELKTKVKGDMVVVGTERISPSSDLSGNGNKESSTGSEDWEQDFDIELTEEDIKAAEEVARKLNVSSKDYTKLTGEQENLELVTTDSYSVANESSVTASLASASAVNTTNIPASVAIATTDAACSITASTPTVKNTTTTAATYIQDVINDEDWENWE